ncbi:MAG TPA: hypothetical protein VI485_27775 [Vicinamibacterales bacterium]|nr:hypothetical protein [Vicinamibacterales bacterium]
MKETFYWRLVAGDQSCGSRTAQEIGPKGTTYLTCDLSPPHWLRTGILKAEKRSAILRISDTTTGLDGLTACADCVDRQVSLTIGYFSRPRQIVVNALALLFLLIVGGLFSHWIGTALPNLRRRKRLKVRLERLRWDINWRAVDLDNDLPSRLATDRSRLADQVASLPAWGNDTADTLTETQHDLELLERRVSLFGRIVGVRERLLRTALTDFRRKVFDRSIAALLLKMAAADEDDRLAALTTELVGLIGTPGESDADFEKWCTAREAELTAIATSIATDPDFSAMAPSCALLRTTFRPANYRSRELTVQKLALIERFVAVKPSPTPHVKTAWAQTVASANDTSALSDPRLELVELENRTTLAQSVTGLDNTVILVRPASPRAFETVVIEFKPSDALEQKLERFSAERVLALRWKVLDAHGKHRFSAVGPTVRCYFPEVGNCVVALTVDGVTVRKPVAVSRSRALVTAQFGLQAARLVGTQFLAAAVAFTTAWEKLASTDVIVVVIAALAAGYGADTLKSAGAAIVSKVTGTGAPASQKQQAFAKASAALDGD